MAEQVVNDTKAEMVRAWRAAMIVGRFMAARRERTLRNARESSVAQERAVRAAVERERVLAEKVYSEALRQSWWDSASQDEAAYVYGVARRFSDMDPQAELAARRCEREAKQRWGIDLNEPVATAQDAPSVEEAMRVAPVLEGESEAEVKPLAQQALYRAYQDGEYQMVGQERAEAILDYVRDHKVSAPPWLQDIWKDDFSKWLGTSEEIDARIRDIYPDIVAAESAKEAALGQASHASEVAGVEAREGEQATRAMQEGESNTDSEVSSEALKEVSEAKHADQGAHAAWDSAQAREAHAQSLLAKGANPQAVRASMTADTGLHQPVSKATKPVKGLSTTPSKPAAKVAAVKTRHM